MTDRFGCATIDLVIACPSKDRWFDLDAVRTEFSTNTHGNPLSPKHMALEAWQRFLASSGWSIDEG